MAHRASWPRSDRGRGAVAASDPRVHVARNKGESETEEVVEIIHNDKIGSSTPGYVNPSLLMITIGLCDRSRSLLTVVLP